MLRPIGKLVHADSSGRLPRLGVCPSEPWATAAHQLADHYERSLGADLIAVALRGSVARQTMVTGASDIDLVLVTRRVVDAPTKIHAAIMPDVPVDVFMITRDDLFDNPRMGWMRFILAFSGWTMWGEDVVAALPDPRLGPHAVGHLHGVDRWSASDAMFMFDAASDERRKRVCQWLMKRIVRSLFESVMCDLGVYTRDIHPCAVTAAAHYPDLHLAIWQAAELAVEPTDEKQSITQVAETLIPLVRHLSVQLRELPPTAPPPYNPQTPQP